MKFSLFFRRFQTFLFSNVYTFLDDRGSVGKQTSRTEHAEEEINCFLWVVWSKAHNEHLDENRMIEQKIIKKSKYEQ